MKAYRVEQEVLTYDRGLFDGYRTVGYYANKTKAEEVAKERNNHRGLTDGKATIEEIEIIE